MRSGRLRIGGRAFPVHSLNTLIIGSGAAGLNAAVRLRELGEDDIAIVTERFGAGASAESGSDKQTYYKLSLAGDVPDSAFDMARDLAAGGSMHGDIALAEALGSLPAFFHLVDLRVPFPHDKFGGYVGYKTDHDPRQRATSAGPTTSHLMFAGLAREVRRRHRVRVFDRHAVIALLTAGAGAKKRAIGALALDTRRLGGRERGFVLFNAVNVVAATGGPGGLYEHSVYPESQAGSHGLLFEAGAVAQNLTESQFGLASTEVRWNVSGTYQQAVPRYISTDAAGGDEREFLNDYFPDMGALATAVFLKGYQWPFDPRKIVGGSSLIDLLVYQETVTRGRRVFLDFRTDARGDGRLAPFEPSMLAREAADYLRKSGALLRTPIARLAKMNGPAVGLYGAFGIDLRREPLEIAVCAQHNNGGFRGSIWWQSSVRGIFPVGELCGTHGVTRPGGSALNAGQVGAARAAMFIARRRAGHPLAMTAFGRAAGPSVLRTWQRAEAMLGTKEGGGLTPEDCLAEIRRRMSGCSAMVRSPDAVARETAGAFELWQRARRELRVRSARDLPSGFKALDLALTSAVYLEAIAEYLERGGKSRGSFLVPDASGTRAHPMLGPEWSFSLAGPEDFVSSHILEIRLDAKGRVRKTWVPVRPVPRPEGWFESVWADYRDDRIVVEEE